MGLIQEAGKNGEEYTGHQKRHGKYFKLEHPDKVEGGTLHSKREVSEDD